MARLRELPLQFAFLVFAKKADEASVGAEMVNKILALVDRLTAAIPDADNRLRRIGRVGNAGRERKQ